MKVSIEAESEEELQAKGSSLLLQLGRAFQKSMPAVADALEKAAALPPREPQLKHQALRDIHARVQRAYGDMLDRMLAEMGQAIDEHVEQVVRDKAAASTVAASPNYASEIVQLESAAYEKMKQRLIPFGYDAADFEEGGALYGMSVNELRDVWNQLREKTG